MLKTTLLALALFTLTVPVLAQQPQTQHPDSRSAQVEEMRKQLDPANAPDPRRQRVAEINAAIDDLNHKSATIQAQQSALAAEKSNLIAALTRDEAKAPYKGQTSYTVVGVKNEDTVILHTCSSAFLYRYPTGESINAELVNRDLAVGSARVLRLRTNRQGPSAKRRLNSNRRRKRRIIQQRSLIRQIARLLRRHGRREDVCAEGRHCRPRPHSQGPSQLKPGNLLSRFQTSLECSLKRPQ